MHCTAYCLPRRYCGPSVHMHCNVADLARPSHEGRGQRDWVRLAARHTATVQLYCNYRNKTWPKAVLKTSCMGAPTGPAPPRPKAEFTCAPLAKGRNHRRNHYQVTTCAFSTCGPPPGAVTSPAAAAKRFSRRTPRECPCKPCCTSRRLWRFFPYDWYC